MAPKKSQVVKSKSSNSAITTKSDREAKPSRNKKTRSSVDFPPHGSKKRGMYVEKKATKQSINFEDKPKSSRQSPPRPSRRDRKKFLASVLTILSKCTTSTQYPDTQDSIAVAREKPTRYRKVKPVKIVEEGTQPEEFKETKQKRQKYKSRILNDVFKEDKHPLVVLKGKKELIHTPSSYSQRSYKDATESNRWANLPPLVMYEEKDTKDRHVEINVENDSVNEDKGIKKGEKEKKIHVNAEPETLVSENKAKSESKLYNFFVDLLETTFNVYNVKGELVGPTPSEIGSRVNFEIDEAVARKLEVTNNEDPLDLDKQCCTSKSYNVMDETIFNKNNKLYASPKSSKVTRNRSPTSIKSPVSRARSPNSRSPGTRSPVSRSPTRSYRRMSSSFAYTQQFKVDSPKAQSVIMPKRSFYRRNKKQTLLNILKQQLRMEDDAFEEPQNLYEALKILARNKRRCRKSIQFDENVKYTENDSPDSECWRRRRIFSASGNSTRRNKFYDERDYFQSFRTSSVMRSNYSDSLTSRSIYTKSTLKPKSNYTTDNETESYHSLEVQEYNYEPNPSKRRKANINKAIVYADASDLTVTNPSQAMYNLAESVASTIEHCKANCTVYRSISQIMLGDS